MLAVVLADRLEHGLAGDPAADRRASSCPRSGRGGQVAAHDQRADKATAAAAAIAPMPGP